MNWAILEVYWSLHQVDNDRVRHLLIYGVIQGHLMTIGDNQWYLLILSNIWWQLVTFGETQLATFDDTQLVTFDDRQLATSDDTHSWQHFMTYYYYDSWWQLVTVGDTYLQGSSHCYSPSLASQRWVNAPAPRTAGSSRSPWQQSYQRRHSASPGWREAATATWNSTGHQVAAADGTTGQ